MVTFWTRMAEIYPMFWMSKYGDCEGGTYDTWQKSLGGITPGQIGCGITKCIHSDCKFPPTLSEFISYCKPEKIFQPVESRLRIAPPDPYAGMTKEEKQEKINGYILKAKQALNIACEKSKE